MHDELLVFGRALHAGATGYITKHESAENVLLAILARACWGSFIFLEQ